jgi:hypothetical protein
MCSARQLAVRGHSFRDDRLAFLYIYIYIYIYIYEFICLRSTVVCQLVTTSAQRASIQNPAKVAFIVYRIIYLHRYIYIYVYLHDERLIRNVDQRGGNNASFVGVLTCTENGRSISWRSTNIILY